MTKAILVIVLVLGIIAAAKHMLMAALAATVVAIVIGLAARWVWQLHRHLPHNRVRDLRIRLRLRVHPGRGHASVFEVWLRWGRLAAFRESGRTRPGLTRRERIRHPGSHSLRLGRAQYRQSVRIPVQEHGALIGPPRAYKTAVLSTVVMEAPGAVVCTSSKPDLFSLTSGLRAQRGPVYLFNPMNIGGLGSNVRWSPLEGCQIPATAIRRADAFSLAVSTAGTEDGTFWSGKASDGLRGFFAAASMTGRDMRQVGRWAGSENEVADAIAILAGAGHDDWAAQLAELTGPAEKTSATIRMVLTRALAFMNDPALADATLPGPGQEFDIDRFLLTGGTLYMLARGNGEESTLAPLFAALASEIQHRAVQLGSAMPGRRLDPPLLMALDEITQICPVPLPQWLADSGGQGVVIWSCFHGMAQLRARWKDAGAQTVLDTSNVRVFLPGIADTATLEAASKLCGKVSFRERGQDDSFEWIPVLTEDMIRQLPSGFALAVRNNLAPVIVRLARGWEHRPYRQLRRRGQEVAAVAAPAMLTAAQPAPAVTAPAAGTLVRTPAPRERVTANGSNGHYGAHPWSAQ
jgi:type IV secretion system protein VirD4